MESSLRIARPAVMIAALALAAWAIPGVRSAHAMDSYAMPAMRSADNTLTNAAGMTLYTFDRDSAGRSACNGGCAASWPPLLADGDDAASGDWSIIARADGTKQWAWKGRPLYAWSKDQKPGDKLGDGFLNGAWHVAR
jgi:predicted lipoprotein with Yx(FWY)xxD motif